ncbi:MAG TPA: ribosome silencing factor [Bacteroidales bacterium]|nr:ribosome silencing factor [Bacteroidales bacterium]
MVKKDYLITAEKLAKTIVTGIQERKGKNIVKINLSKIKNIFTDYFVICSGDSNTHVRAISESIEKEVKENLGMDSYHKEGVENSFWVLLDYGNIIVHIFQPETRDFYNLEELWADGEIENIKDENNS